MFIALTRKIDVKRRSNLRTLRSISDADSEGDSMRYRYRTYVPVTGTLSTRIDGPTAAMPGAQHCGRRRRLSRLR